MLRKGAAITLGTVLLVTVAAALSGAGATAGSATQPEETNRSLGTTISSFMQVSAVETQHEVDREMWEAAFENAKSEAERKRLLEQRERALERRIDALNESRSEAGVRATVGAQIRKAVIEAQIDALRTDIEDAVDASNRTATDAPGLVKLQQRTVTLDRATPDAPAIADGDGPDRTPGRVTTDTPSAENPPREPASDSNDSNGSLPIVGDGTEAAGEDSNGSNATNSTSSTGSDGSTDSNDSDPLGTVEDTVNGTLSALLR
ncbi:hypothetical protein ACFQPA_00650 [Halomarina halobia]|uniref:OmpH family outer membrane protein n=1 Tax=Halomarina halobia TaxID=3033386 RepID=A0ABD6A7K4_9EURY|nr:hypothetical protein [Halomarina sp. PSR21]